VHGVELSFQGILRDGAGQLEGVRHHAVRRGGKEFIAVNSAQLTATCEQTSQITMYVVLCMYGYFCRNELRRLYGRNFE
jgi:hypothetical protein